MEVAVRFVLPCLLLFCAPARGQSLAGSWEGAIAQGGRSIRTVLHLVPDADGGLAGSVDSPEQNGFGFGLAEIVQEGTALSFRVPETNGAWSGHLDQAGEKLVGTWKQRGAELPLVFARVEVDPLVGTWQGALDLGPTKLRLVFHVGTRQDGSLGASMVSPDQSPAYIPVTRVEMKDDGLLRFEVNSIGAVFEGRPDDAAARIEGKLLQSGASLPLTLDKVATPAVRRRPQTPSGPFPYRAEEVSYANDVAGNRLAGTLTLPEGDGPFAAVLLITGSGQQDRNEEIFGHKLFLVIADFLTRAGIAVLRVDDRGIGGSTGDVASATSADFATDVSAGVDYLRSRPEIRAEHIGLLGHSEGGLIAPLVAVERGDIGFLVLLAGPGIPGDQILYLQSALLAKAAGADDPAVAASRALQERLFAVLREESDPKAARAKLKEILASAPGVDGADMQLEQIASPWMRFFVNHDPAPTLRQVTCPVLALNGSLDLQVPPQEDLTAIAAALEAAGNKDFETREYPGLNHLFQHCTTGAVAEYGEIEETISPEVPADIAKWIQAHVRGP